MFSFMSNHLNVFVSLSCAGTWILEDFSPLIREASLVYHKFNHLFSEFLFPFEQALCIQGVSPLTGSTTPHHMLLQSFRNVFLALLSSSNF